MKADPSKYVFRKLSESFKDPSQPTISIIQPFWPVWLWEVLEFFPEKAATQVALSNGLISLGTMQTCARFCVMDDESNEEKMVQLYRDFSEDRTDGNGNSALNGGRNSMKIISFSSWVKQFTGKW